MHTPTTPEPSSPLSLPPSSPPHPPRAPTTPTRNDGVELFPSDTSYVPTPPRPKAVIQAENRAAGQVRRHATLARKKAALAQETETPAKPDRLPMLLSLMLDGKASESRMHTVDEVQLPEHSERESNPLLDTHDELPYGFQADNTSERNMSTNPPPMKDIAAHVFRLLDSYNVSWGTLLEFISNPNSALGRRRWYGFFKDENCVHQVLDHWASSRNRKGRHRLRRWAIKYVSKLVDQEGNKVGTESGILRARNKPVNKTFVLGFELPELRQTMETLCPTMINLIKSFSTTSRQERRRRNDTSEMNFMKQYV